MFSTFLDKMTEQQRTAIERLADATLLEMLSDSDIVSQSKWETKRALKD
jgi:hypothetical protein